MGPRGIGHNADYDWDDFDPDAYYAHNYRELRVEDRYIIEQVRDHFADAHGSGALTGELHGIDVGTGSNLYPAMTMLPFCAEVTLFERSARNMEWLEREKDTGCRSWEEAWHQFWHVLTKRDVYAQFAEPQKELVSRMRPKQGSVYRLAPDTPYDMGTMFFVAESITTHESEFRSGMDHFLGALAPGAPFAIAFMEHSAGYTVGGRRFPAADVDLAKVSEYLRDRGVSDIRIEHVDRGVNPIRIGYTGMLLALGRVNVGSHEGTRAPV